MTRLALVLAALAAPASAASIDWRVDPVTGAVIGFTGERADPLDAARPRRAPLTKGGRLSEFTQDQVKSLGDYWFTCPAWSFPWEMPTETICRSPLGGEPLHVASEPERPPLWLSGRLTETRAHVDARPEPDRPRNGAGPEPTPARVPAPPALVLLTAAVAAMWRMKG